MATHNRQVLENIALTTAKEVSENCTRCLVSIWMSLRRKRINGQIPYLFLYDVPAGTSISLLKDGAEADPQVTVFVPLTVNI